MAMNPMQRRARNAFLIGFLIAAIGMALVVIALLFKMKTLNETIESLKSVQKQCYVASQDLTSGQSLVFDEHFEMATVQTTMDTSTIITSDDFEFVDEEGNIEEKYNKDGTRLYKELVMKVDVPAGSLVTKDMFIEAGEETLDTHRIQEYNMIVLPSQLKNGDFVDIRLTLPSGQDYVVLSKKKVLGTTNQAVWFKLDEEELLTMNNAIVESYKMAGSKLYAIQYVEPGMQNAIESTYVVSAAVLDLINTNPNITEVAKAELWNRYNANSRVNYFESILTLMDVNEATGAVEDGTASEVEAIKAARQSYVDSLEGTEEIGYSR